MTQSIDDSIEDFFRVLESMPEMTLRHVTAVWREHEEDGSRIAASVHARSIVRNSRRQRQFELALNDLRSWLNGRATPAAGIFGISQAAQIAAAGEATPALVDCLLAIVAADQLASAEYDVLVLPVGDAVRADRHVAIAEDVEAASHDTIDDS